MTYRTVGLCFAQLLLACVFSTTFATPGAQANCASINTAPDVSTSYAEGWGIDHRNTRFQPHSSLNSTNAAALKLKWVYGLASTTPRAYPLVTTDTIFVGDGGRGVVALDRDTGCERWVYEHPGNIASAIVLASIGDRPILIFNDRTQGTYAIDAKDGAFIWHASVEDEPIPWYSATPLVTADTVYVPVSSLEVGLAMNPLFGCCTTSGGIAALDIKTGEKLWYLPTIEEPAQHTGTHFLFVDRYGPSGAAIWGAPSYDETRNWLYFGTGQNYSHPTTDTSDAIFAVDATTGEVQWIHQYTANDAYTAACNNIEWNHPNCPKPTGPDVDFGAPTMLLRTAEGRELLVAGQKSAEVHAMDPATGETVWTQRLGRGGIIGGVHWGLAANESLGLIFVPISDKGLIGFPSPGEAAPGLYAIDIATGERRWAYSRKSRCDEEQCVYGLSSAIIAANDIVVTGSIDGYLEVMHAVSGKRLWSYDAWRDFTAINNIDTTGGAFDAHGPMLADDLLIVSSGYGYVGRQRGGNALLVFEVENKND